MLKMPSIYSMAKTACIIAMMPFVCLAAAYLENDRDEDEDE